jgi:DNA-binding CsgD family transcriptional regulator
MTAFTATARQRRADYHHRVATYRGRERCLERIDRLARSTASGESLHREVIAELRRAIGFDRWCWPLADPDTLVPGGGDADHDYGPDLPRALELEYSGSDFGAKDALARRRKPSISLTAETHGDLMRSPRWEQVLGPVGIGDIAAVACRDDFGCWGWIELYRDRSDRAFTEDDVELLANIAPALGSALRRQVQVRTGRDSAVGPPGVLVLNHDLTVRSQTPSARHWSALLPGATAFASWGMLHAVIYPIATLARSGMSHRAHAILPAVDGTWVRIEAEILEGDGDLVVVTLRGAAPAEMFELACRTHGLTPRERQVVALLVAGRSTEDICHRMLITPYTLQDHLKSVFDKLSVHSRTQVVAQFGDAGPTSFR